MIKFIVDVPIKKEISLYGCLEKVMGMIIDLNAKKTAMNYSIKVIPYECVCRP